MHMLPGNRCLDLKWVCELTGKRLAQSGMIFCIHHDRCFKDLGWAGEHHRIVWSPWQIYDQKKSQKELVLNQKITDDKFSFAHPALRDLEIRDHRSAMARARIKKNILDGRDEISQIVPAEIRNWVATRWFPGPDIKWGWGCKRINKWKQQWMGLKLIPFRRGRKITLKSSEQRNRRYGTKCFAWFVLKKTLLRKTTKNNICASAHPIRGYFAVPSGVLHEIAQGWLWPLHQVQRRSQTGAVVHVETVEPLSPNLLRIKKNIDGASVTQNVN